MLTKDDFSESFWHDADFFLKIQKEKMPLEALQSKERFVTFACAFIYGDLECGIIGGRAEAIWEAERSLGKLRIDPGVGVGEP